VDAKLAQCLLANSLAFLQVPIGCVGFFARILTDVLYDRRKKHVTRGIVERISV